MMLGIFCKHDKCNPNEVLCLTAFSLKYLLIDSLLIFTSPISGLEQTPTMFALAHLFASAILLKWIAFSILIISTILDANSQSPNHSLNALVRTSTHCFGERFVSWPLGALSQVPLSFATRSISARSAAISAFCTIAVRNSSAPALYSLKVCLISS